MVFFIATGCVYTPKVEHLEDGEEWGGEGILYALPRTSFDVVFEVSQVNFGAPVCKDPSDELLKRIDLKSSLVSNNKRTVHMVKSSSMEAKPVPDKNKVYVMHLPESSNWSNTSLQITINENGIIESVESSATSKAVEIASKVLEIGLNVAVGLSPAGAKSEDTLRPDECEQAVVAYEALKQEWNNFRATGFDISPELLGIYRSEIEKEQAAQQAHFTGKVDITLSNIVCHVSPKDMKSIPLFDVETKQGFKLHEGCRMTGDKITTSTAPLQCSDDDSTCDIKHIVMNIKNLDKQKTRNANFTLIDKTNTDSSLIKEKGFYYNIPIEAIVSISGHSKAAVEDKIYTLPQLGSVGALPRFKGNSPAMTVALHPETGALKTVKVTNDAADLPGLFSTVATGATNYLAAKAAQDAKAAEVAAKEALEKDELTILTRTKNLAETKLAIEVAKEALAVYTNEEN